MELKQKLPELNYKIRSNSHEGILSYAKVCSRLINPVQKKKTTIVCLKQPF